MHLCHGFYFHSWDFHHAFLSRHSLSLGIPYYEPNHVTSGSDIQSRLYCNSGRRHRVEPLIRQAYVDRLLAGGKVVAVAIEHASQNGQRINVPPIRLMVAKMSYVHAREDRELGIESSRLEVLRVELDRKIAYLVAGEERL